MRILVFVLFMVPIFSVFADVSNWEYNQLVDKYNDLVSDFKTLQSNGNDDIDDYNKLLNNKKKLTKKYNELLDERNEFSKKHDNLCSKIGQDINSNRKMVADASTNNFTTLRELDSLTKESAVKDLIYGFMIINARIEKTKEKIIKLDASVELYQNRCSPSGDNLDAINSTKSFSTNALKQQENHDEIIMEVFNKVTQQ